MIDKTSAAKFRQHRRLEHTSFVNNVSLLFFLSMQLFDDASPLKVVRNSRETYAWKDSILLSWIVLSDLGNVKTQINLEPSLFLRRKLIISLINNGYFKIFLSVLSIAIMAYCDADYYFAY